MFKINIKTKLALGISLMFALIMAVGFTGVYYLTMLGSDTKAIIKANYESLEYCNNMFKAFDTFESKPQAVLAFEKNLALQENNITESGEQEVTSQLREVFNQLKSDALPQAIAKYQFDIKKYLYRIEELNMQAIVRKNKVAEQTEHRASIWIAIVSTFSFLVAFTFSINFPGYIANPIRELTESIKEIADKNYSTRLHFKRNDEFGELAEAFNAMAEKLDSFENSNLAKILFQKRRIEAIINNMSDAIIGLDEHKHILFANPVATSLLNLSEKVIVGKYAPDVALHNDLLRSLLQDNHTGMALKIYANERESYFSKEIIEVKNEEQPIGFVILLKNITSFQELNLAKTNFIAKISHELKGPILGIKTSLQLLENPQTGNINTEQQQLINSIKENNNQLLKITDELLDRS